MGDRNFSWIDNPDVVVKMQMPIAIFENSRAEVCIRQQGEDWQDEDQWVTFSKDRVVTVVRAILEVAGIDPDEVFRDTTRDGAQDGINNGTKGFVGYSDDRRDGDRDATGTAAKSKDKTKADRQKRYRRRLKERRDATRDGPATRETGATSIGDGSDAPRFELEPAGMARAGR